MYQYPRTHLGVLLTIGALFAVTSVTASAQMGNTRSNSGQAVLHIRINIVPVVMTPPAQEPNKPLATAITYNVPGFRSNVEMINETRPFASPGSGGFQGAVLRTTTIVAR